MRVLSRRSNLPKAVACGYSEGAGFACSNGTLPLGPLPAFSPCDLDHSDGVRGLWPGACWGVIQVQFVFVLSGSWPSPSRGRARCDVGVAATPRWRRRGVQGAQRPCTRLCPTLSSARSRPTPISSRGRRGDGVGRRPKTPRDGVGERSPVRALPSACGFSHREAEAIGTRLGGAQLHKNCSTAAATTAHVVHRSLRCTRDRYAALRA